MKTLLLLIVAVMLSACGVTVENPSVKVDTAKLQELPPGAGYVILQRQSKGLVDMYRSYGQKGMNVDLALKSICRFDSNSHKIITPKAAHDPREMMMWAFQVHLSGGMAEKARAKGWPLARTDVMIGQPGTEDLCGVTTVIEDGLTPDQVQQRLVRIFSAGRQLGMQLSCNNVAC